MKSQISGALSFDTSGLTEAVLDGVERKLRPLQDRINQLHHMALTEPGQPLSLDQSAKAIQDHLPGWERPVWHSDMSEIVAHLVHNLQEAGYHLIQVPVQEQPPAAADDSTWLDDLKP